MPFGAPPNPGPYGAPAGPGWGAPIAAQPGQWAGSPWLQPAPPSYAHWGWRVLARLIDELVVYVPIVAISFGIGLAWAISHPGSQLTDHQAQLLGAPAYLVAVIIWFVNRCVIAGRTGKSLGRLATGTRLVRESTGRPLGVWMAFVREFANILNRITLGIGYLRPLWNAKRQTFADEAVKSVVLR
ncbi:MAG: RDD family protein [Cellulomonas sp.]|nr:RDD family protein [Cellulomonas sp.]